MADTQLRAWRAFLEAHSAITRRLEDELRAEKGLPLSWYDALVQLSEAGGRLRMGELADRLLISRSATTRFVDRLEREGLLERHAVAEDRRGTEVRITRKGRSVLRGAAPVHLRGIRQHFADHLDEEEASRLTELLDRLASAARRG